jgi:hypothetical protein
MSAVYYSKLKETLRSIGITRNLRGACRPAYKDAAAVGKPINDPA